jgi:integrase
MPRPRTGQVYVEWHGDHWDVRIDLPDGSRSRRACMPSSLSKEEAKAEGRRLKALAWRAGATLATEEQPEDTGETMDRWFVRWLAEREERGLASVRDDDGRWRRWLFPLLGDRPVAAVSRRDLERVVEDLDKRVRAGELSWKTARHVWGMCTKMFSDACRSKRLDLRVREDNPAKDVRGPDRGADKAKAYLYPEELVAVLSCSSVPLRWRRLFALMVYTYARPGELAALEWSDVDFTRGTIHIHRALDDDGKAKPTKTKVTRRIPIETNLRPLLAVLKAEASGPRVVPSMPPECDLSKRLRDYLKRAGVARAELFANDATRKQIRFYDLRATGITWMALRGDEPLRIMQRAGHTEFSTTMGYVRAAETLGDVGEPFPPLPPLDATEPETPATWGALRGVGRPGFPPKFPTQAPVSTRNSASPAGPCSWGTVARARGWGRSPSCWRRDADCPRGRLAGYSRRPWKTISRSRRRRPRLRMSLPTSPSPRICRSPGIRSMRGSCSRSLEASPGLGACLRRRRPCTRSRSRATSTD